MKNIILSPGHNELSWGAMHNGVKEYELARSVVQAVDDLNGKIGGAPFRLITIMPNNQSLKRKIKLVNDIDHVDLAVELHWNAFGDPAVKGSEAFYMEGDGMGWIAAESYCRIFQQISGVPTRGAKLDSQSQHSRLAWCRDIRHPSILVENEFLTADAFNPHYYFHLSIVAMIQFLVSFSRR